MNHETPRTSPALPAHIGSRSACRYNAYTSSYPTNTSGKTESKKSKPFSLRFLLYNMVHGCRLQKYSFYIPVTPVLCLIPGDHYDIETILDFMTVSSVAFPDQALDTVPDHAVAYPLTDGYANTGRGFLPSRKHIHHQRAKGNRPSRLVDLLKVTILFQIHVLFHAAFLSCLREKTKGHNLCGLRRITAFYLLPFWQPKLFCRWLCSFFYGSHELLLSVWSSAGMSSSSKFPSFQACP